MEKRKAREEDETNTRYQKQRANNVIKGFKISYCIERLLVFVVLMVEGYDSGDSGQCEGHASFDDDNDNDMVMGLSAAPSALFIYFSTTPTWYRNPATASNLEPRTCLDQLLDHAACCASNLEQLNLEPRILLESSKYRNISKCSFLGHYV